jgi:uncharacterized protein (DUF1778 family)
MATTTIKDEKARFDARLPKRQKLLFERAAALAGFRSLTDFVIQAVQEKTKEIIKESEIILASERDSRIFFDAIMNPENPNKKLVSASKQFNKLLSK